MSGRPRTTSFAEGNKQPLNPPLGGMKISSKSSLTLFDGQLVNLGRIAPPRNGGWRPTALDHGCGPSYTYYQHSIWLLSSAPNSRNVASSSLWLLDPLHAYRAVMRSATIKYHKITALQRSSQPQSPSNNRATYASSVPLKHKIHRSYYISSSIFLIFPFQLSQISSFVT